MDDGFAIRVGTGVKKKERPYRLPGVWSTVPASALNGGSLSTGPAALDATQDRDYLPALLGRWAKDGDSHWPATDTVESLDPGVYHFAVLNNIGIAVVARPVSTDNLLELPDSASAEVLTEFQKFWTLGPEFDKRGFLFKRGVLLWGPPGSGKTASLNLMFGHVVNEYGGIVCILDDPNIAAAGLRMIRKIEPERPIIAVIEDIDALIETYGENLFLALLDGETQVNRIAYIATTNYPERLDRRFVDRPSRFDTIKFIGMPTAAARRQYLSIREPSLIGAELEEWVSQSDGFSIAHLRELVILVRCFGRTLKQAVDRLETMRAKAPNSGDAPDKTPFGFGSFGK